MTTQPRTALVLSQDEVDLLGHYLAVLRHSKTEPNGRALADIIRGAMADAITLDQPEGTPSP